MVRLRERMEAALPPPPSPPPPPPLLVPKEGYRVRWNKPPKDTSPEAKRKREYMRNYMRDRRRRLPEAAGEEVLAHLEKKPGMAHGVDHPGVTPAHGALHGWRL
jgi:hypothetical protein